MMELVSLQVPFQQLLEVIDRIDVKGRDLLRNRLIKREEEVLVRQAEQAAQAFQLKNLPSRITYWSVEKVLNKLKRKLEVYEQNSGKESKAFYLAFKRANGSSAEETQWARLYESYQRLRAAKRRVDIKAGRVVEPILIGKVLSKQLTMSEISKKLASFEERYNISSADFYAAFKQGQRGDSAETFEWVHTYTAYLTINDHKEVKGLQGAGCRVAGCRVAGVAGGWFKVGGWH